MNEPAKQPSTPPTAPPTEFENTPVEDNIVTVMIPYRNSCALIGYYVGIFSLVPAVGVILAPIAIVFGIIGLRNGIKHPENRGKIHAIVAIVLGLLGCYNYVAIVLLVMKA